MAVTPGDKVVYMNERIVGEAEKEASEVLHSLLSVERIEKPNRLQNIQHQVVVLNSNGEEIQWHNNGMQNHESLFTLDNANCEYSRQDNAIVWDNTLTLDVETTAHPSEQIQVVSDILGEPFVQPQSLNKAHASKKGGHKWQRKALKSPDDTDEIVVEDNGNSDDANDVKQRFKLGCECQDDSCFRGLNPDNVYRHRLNIAELTKEEHDMYLMGVTMACMSDPGVTVKRRERRRLRAQYVYQGRRVCLAAFLYLENCTLYQLKRIRKHVMTHGVTPRVHGNHGKKPHNVFSLETYCRATDFLKQYIDQHNTNTGNCKNSVIFPPEISKKTIHNAYLEYLRISAPPEEKTMGYSTFRHFMKEQFPHVRFCKVELGTQNSNSFSSLSCKHQTTCHNNLQTHRTTSEEPCTLVMQSQTAPTTAPVQTLSTIPLLIQEQQNKPELAAQTTYIVTPMSQLVQTPYPAAHTITVTPLTNYAFTTM